MMKCKGLYVLATAAMLALAAGCGSDEVKNTDNQVTGAVLPTEVTETPEATATSEPTATPAPTATPKPANYMEANGIEVWGAGWHTCKGFMADEADENGDPIMELVDREYCMEVTEVENDGITKVIKVEMHANPYVNEYGGNSGFVMSGFVDLKTGKAFFPMEPDYLQTTVLKQGEEEVELQLAYTYDYPSVTYPYFTERFTLVCPADYDDAGFYLTGYNWDWETFVERSDTWKMLNFIRHGDSDMVVFGVNKTLETPMEKKGADGAEQAAENYFEEKGLTTKGAGEYTFWGAEGLRKRNVETGYWETASVEAKETTITVSCTEESLGDGIKKVQWVFSYTSQMPSEEEARVPFTISGIADKKTGLCYGTRGYCMAEPYILEKDGEEMSILVGMDYAEELRDDGTLKSYVTYVLTCPEDYEDAVLFVAGDKRTDEDAKFKNTVEVISLDDIDHGECDILFFE